MPCSWNCAAATAAIRSFGLHVKAWYRSVSDPPECDRVGRSENRSVFERRSGDAKGDGALPGEARPGRGERAAGPRRLRGARASCGPTASTTARSSSTTASRFVHLADARGRRQPARPGRRVPAGSRRRSASAATSRRSLTELRRGRLVPLRRGRVVSGAGHEGRSLAAEDAAADLGLRDVPRRARRDGRDRVRRRQDDAALRRPGDRRPARDARGSAATGSSWAAPTSRSRRRTARSRPGAARADNPVGGWYGLKKGLRGRFGMYMPPLLEELGMAEVEHNPRNNRMRAM